MRDLQSACIRGLRSDWARDDAFWQQEFYPYREQSLVCHLTREGNEIMADSVGQHLEQSAAKGAVRWQPKWPHVVESDRLWQDYLSESNPVTNQHMTQLERFVEFFSRAPKTR
jgi:hypothetical protein